MQSCLVQWRLPDARVRATSRTRYQTVMHMAILAFALCSPFAASCAQAAADHFVQAFVDARGNGATQQQDTGPIDGPTASAGPVGFHVVDQFGSFDSDISATATYGHLSGQGNASQDSPKFARQSDVNADRVEFRDRITLSSPTLSLGTVVTLNVTMIVTDKLSSPILGTCCANVAVNGRQTFSGFNFGDQAFGGQSIDHQITRTIALDWFIGAPNDIGAILFFDASSGPPCCQNGAGSSRVDLADVRFFLTLPGDVRATAASGTNYLPPQASVPEPVTGLLLGLGGVALICLRRSPRRHERTSGAPVTLHD